MKKKYLLKNKPEISAYAYGLRLLSYHSYSEAVVVEKMQRVHYSKSEIQEAIEKLKRYGFINDFDLARFYFNKYFSSGKNGAYLIRAKLKQKGICSDMIDECLCSYDHSIAFEQALRLAKTHFSVLQLQDKSKVSRYLATRGFSSEIIQNVLQSLRCE